MKKSKKPQHNTDKMLLDRNEHWSCGLLEEAYQYFPSKDQLPQRLKYTMFHFLETTDCLQIEDFLFAYRITRQQFNRYCEKHPELKQAKEDFKIFLAQRRRDGVMRFKLQPQYTYKDMHVYDKEWGPQVDSYHAKLKEDAQLDSGIQVVYLPSVKETEELKKHKEKKEKK